MFETELPVSGRAPTGAHPHIAHTNGIRVSPFHEDGAAWTAWSDRDEALEPRDREPLVLAIGEKIRRVHANLTGRKISHVKAYRTLNTPFRLTLKLIWHELTKSFRTLSGCLRSYLITDILFSHPPSMISYMGLDSPFRSVSAMCPLLIAFTSISTEPLRTAWNLYCSLLGVFKGFRPYRT